MGRLEGKTAIITGAGTGIGEAIAHKFVREGAEVLLVGLPGDPVEDVADTLRELGGNAEAYEADISLEEDANASIAACIEAFGKLDILINNAGVFLFTGETQDYPSDLFMETLKMNVASTFYMTRAALPHLQHSRGVVISTGSESGVIGLEGNAVYGGTKAWVHSFMQGVAVEQGKYGVRANCVCPGPVDTAWTHKETGPMTAEMEKGLVGATVFGRRGTVEEIANVFAFIASDEASYVTGALWLVDGATTILKGPVGEKAPDDVKREPDLTLPVHHTLDGMRNKHFISRAQ